jgi:hypothetical protein
MRPIQDLWLSIEYRLENKMMDTRNPEDFFLKAIDEDLIWQ